MFYTFIDHTKTEPQTVGKWFYLIFGNFSDFLHAQAMYKNVHHRKMCPFCFALLATAKIFYIAN